MYKIIKWLDKRLTTQQQGSIAGWIGVIIWAAIIATLSYHFRKH